MFNLFPGLRPDEPCSKAPAGQIVDLTLDDSVSRGDALVLANASTTGLSEERLLQPGKLVNFRASTEGLEGKPLQIRTWVLRATGGPVADAELRDQLALVLEPGSCEDPGRVHTVWSPLPREAGSYRIEVRLFDQSARERLDVERTETFPTGES